MMLFAGLFAWPIGTSDQPMICLERAVYIFVASLKDGHLRDAVLNILISKSRRLHKGKGEMAIDHCDFLIFIDTLGLFYYWR